MDNLRGSIFMVFAMACFAIEDMFIKQLAGALPVGQILMVLGTGAVLFFVSFAWWRGVALWSRDLRHRAVILRNLSEAFGTIGFVTALALTPISSASAILQATPLVVTLGAALFLGERVGWRRWSAIAVGLCGVLLVIRPGLDGFQPASLFAVMGVMGLAMRDIATRMVPVSISSTQLSTYAFATLIPTGLFLLLITDATAVMPERADMFRLAATIGIGIVAYIAIVAATRTGEVAVVSPFRYSRLIFALIVGVLVFDERPDALTLIGAAIIVGSGLYTLMRETQARRNARRASLAAAAKL